MQRWLPQRCAEGRVNERTFERYAGIINAHLTPTIGSLKLRGIRPDHIAELKVRWLGGREFAEPPSGASVAKHLNVLRRAFRDAMEAGLVTSNPVEAVSSRSTAPAHEQRALTPEEITQLVSAASGTRFDVPIRFTVATGVRQSEMLSLWWEDVQLDDALVFLRGTKTANSRRTLELSNVSVAMLRAHEQDQRARQVFLGPAWTDHSLIFPTRVGTPWPRRTPYRDYHRRRRVGDPRTRDGEMGHAPPRCGHAVDQERRRHLHGQPPPRACVRGVYDGSVRTPATRSAAPSG